MFIDAREKALDNTQKVFFPAVSSSHQTLFNDSVDHNGAIKVNAFFTALNNGDIKAVDDAIKDGFDVNHIHATTGRTPLIEVIIDGKLSIVKV